jgi:hypothetical protein
MAALVTALIAAFIPGASPPEVSTPIVDIFAILSKFLDHNTQIYKISESVLYFCRLKFEV